MWRKTIQVLVFSLYLLYFFRSDEKFDSGCGWPSFSASEKNKIEEEKDTTHGMVRTEVHCAKVYYI